jgi:deoxyribonuclease (pyrimidine dimer)
MTRINLVPPEELADQHLMAEYREMPMVPAALRRSLKTRRVEDIKKGIPKEFTLNKGHVTFFYDKMAYLKKRYEIVCNELKARGFKLDENRALHIDNFPVGFYNDYEPDEAAYAIIRARIAERVAMKPNWYRFTK